MYTPGTNESNDKTCYKGAQVDRRQLKKRRLRLCAWGFLTSLRIRSAVPLSTL